MNDAFSSWERKHLEEPEWRCSWCDQPLDYWGMYCDACNSENDQ